MSVIPFTTQIGLSNTTQGSQNSMKVVLVYTDKITERQAALMKECQAYLCQNVGTVSIQVCELSMLSPKMKYFVIESPRDDLIKKIRDRFEKPIIYLPRAVIEALGFFNVQVPSRHLALSMSMHKCHIFLVKSCDIPSIRSKISEMCGVIVTSFNDSDLNVVVTDRADDKYSIRAAKKKIPVVSRDWIDASYNIAAEEDNSYFNYEALGAVGEHQIRPFYGLHFKILIPNSGPKLKKLITENQGRIIYGNENCLTHIVVEDQTANDAGKNGAEPPVAEDKTHKPKVVDLNFLNTCTKLGFYISKREYVDCQQNVADLVKQRKTQLTSQQSRPKQSQGSVMKNSIQAPDQLASANAIKDGHYRTTQGARKTDENRHNRFAPPQALRPQPPSNMSDIIWRALTTDNTAQTQLASTQMRRLPDQELRIEQTFEPSQQLYWSDSAPRKA